MNLEDMMFSGISQTQKDRHCEMPLRALEESDPLRQEVDGGSHGLGRGVGS